MTLLDSTRSIRRSHFTYVATEFLEVDASIAVQVHPVRERLQALLCE